MAALRGRVCGCAAVLVLSAAAALVIWLLRPALAGAAGPLQRRGVTDWMNGNDVVGNWGWSVGSSGSVVHWPRGSGTVHYLSIGANFDNQAIDMATAKVGYLVTMKHYPFYKARVYKTTDGGRHWKNVKTAKVDLLAAVKFRSAKLGWVAGRSGTILKTTNGGKTWVKQRTGTSATLYSLSFPSNKVGYAVGEGGVVLKTTNAGKKWRKQVSGTVENLYGVDFVSANTGWAVGGDATGACVNTTNGGTTWAPQGGTQPPLVAVDFVDASTGWVVGNVNGWADPQGRVIKVTGGGTTWTDQSATVDAGLPDYGLACLKVVDALHAYAEGESEASIYTDDGENWHLEHIATR